MSEYKIRKLTRKDRVTFTALIKKFMASIGDDSLSTMMVAEKASTKEETDSQQGNEAKMAYFAVELLNKMVDVLDSDVAVWFSSLLNMELEDFTNNTPFDIELIVIEQLVESEDMSNFFGRASRLYNKTKGSLDKLKV